MRKNSENLEGKNAQIQSIKTETWKQRKSCQKSQTSRRHRIFRSAQERHKSTIDKR